MNYMPDLEPLGWIEVHIRGKAATLDMLLDSDGSPPSEVIEESCYEPDELLAMLEHMALGNQLFVVDYLKEKGVITAPQRVIDFDNISYDRKTKRITAKSNLTEESMSFTAEELSEKMDEDSLHRLIAALKEEKKK